MTLKGAVAKSPKGPPKGPPQGIERRATERSSFKADRDRAILISVLIHAVALALILLVLPHLPRGEIAAPSKPIAITMVDAPDADPVPEAQAPDAPSASVEPAAPQAEAAAALPTAPAEPQMTTVLPTDPSFDPFALSPRAEVREAQPQQQFAQSQSNQAVVAPPVPQAVEGGNGGGEAQGQDQGGGSGQAGGPNAGGTAGGGGDPMAVKWKQQYLYMHTFGGGFNYKPELKKFLRRLIECGVEPIKSPNYGLTIEADIVFNPNGMVQFAQLTNPGSFAADPGYQQAAQQLMTALGRQGCAYAVLPPMDYRNWRQAHLSFFQHAPGP